MVNFNLKYWKQILLLLLITPFLTELLTNNLTVGKFFKPKLFLILVTTIYAPVLLLRELAVRWRLGFIGYIMLGLVYGIYNEGLFAKTIFQTQLPNPAFNNYGVVWEINFPWFSNISVFHAFYAFLFPVLIVNYFFPSASRKPWMDKRMWLLISAAFFIYISWGFLNNMPPPITTLHYLFLVVMIIAIAVLAKYFKDEKMFVVKRINLWQFCLYGFLFVAAMFILSNLMIGWGVNPVIFILYIFAVFIATIMLLHKKCSRKSLLVFCLSAEIAFAGCTFWVAKVMASRTRMETSIFFIIIFSIALIMVMFKNRRSGSPGSFY